MALYLVQHGKSYSKDEDPDRKLTNEGSVEVKRIADVAAAYGVKISSIKHSGKKRALQSAVLLAIALDVSDVELQEGMSPNDDVKSFVEKNIFNDNIMFVGHLPFLEKLTSYLITGSVETPPFKFQNGGIVCLDKFDDRWMIKWALNPNVN